MVFIPSNLLNDVYIELIDFVSNLRCSFSLPKRLYELNNEYLVGLDSPANKLWSIDLMAGFLRSACTFLSVSEGWAKEEVKLYCSINQGFNWRVLEKIISLQICPELRQGAQIFVPLY